MIPTLKEFPVGDKTYHCTTIDLLKQVDTLGSCVEFKGDPFTLLFEDRLFRLET